MQKIIISLIILSLGGMLFAQDVDAIIDAYLENVVHESSRGKASMEVQNRFGTRRIDMIVYARGAHDALIEFTSRAELGQKVLRSKDDIYLYYPDASEIIRLQGSALRQSMQGSDVSYEDLTGGRSLTESYTIRYEGIETVNDVETFKIMLTAKKRNLAYPKQDLWINTESFVLEKSQLYSLNDRLLKVITTLKTEIIDGKTVATEISIIDALKKNTETILRYEEFEVDVAIDPAIFSLEELTF